MRLIYSILFILLGVYSIAQSNNLALVITDENGDKELTIKQGTYVHAKGTFFSRSGVMTIGDDQTVHVGESSIKIDNLTSIRVVEDDQAMKSRKIRTTGLIMGAAGSAISIGALKYTIFDAGYSEMKTTLTISTFGAMFALVGWGGAIAGNAGLNEGPKYNFSYRYSIAVKEI